MRITVRNTNTEGTKTLATIGGDTSILLNTHEAHQLVVALKALIDFVEPQRHTRPITANVDDEDESPGVDPAGAHLVEADGWRGI